uniref:Uncharacterized protein n=1 Tax=Sus scrofa TaxID=9823 RepID=A0A4X1TPE8_PIG
MLSHDHRQTFLFCCLSTAWKDSALCVNRAEGTFWGSRDLGFRAGDLLLAPSRCLRTLLTRKTVSSHLDQVIPWLLCLPFAPSITF